jgi:hypothetical protein
MAGTTFHGTDGVWNSANNLGTASTSNWMATATNNFDITGVQIDLGPDALPYRGRDYQDELQLCKRYYQHSFVEGVFPTFTGPDANGTFSFVAHSATLANAIFSIPFPVSMRVAPTVTNYNFTDGTTGEWENVDKTLKQDMTVSNISEKMATWAAATDAIADGDQLAGHFALDAEL